MTLLPTPKVTNRKSKRAMTGRSYGGQSSPPGLEETADLLTGNIPEHLPRYEHLPPVAQRQIDALLPTPRAGEPQQTMDPQKWDERAAKHAEHGQSLQPSLTVEVGRLPPTPTAVDMGRGKDIDEWDGWTDEMHDRHGNDNGHGRSLEIEAQRLLPTPQVSDSFGGKPLGSDLRNKDGYGTMLRDLPANNTFGPYQAAITRWEAVLGRPAPSPTEAGKDGRQRLSPRFVEWMLGLPDGWVTDPTLGVSRTHQLKLLGNAVVPQQAVLALRILMQRIEEEH